MEKYAIRIDYKLKNAELLRTVLPKEFLQGYPAVNITDFKYFIYPNFTDWSGYRMHNHLANDLKEGCNIISVQEFIKIMQNKDKKIIGYKCPMDLFNGRIKKGEVFCIYGYEKVVMYTKDYRTSGIPIEIVETWEPVYEEDIVKIFPMSASNGNFELEVSKKGIYYRIEDSWLNISDVLNILSYGHCQYSIGYHKTGYSSSNDRYGTKVSKIDVGCKKDTLVSEWKLVYDHYKSLT